MLSAFVSVAENTTAIYSSFNNSTFGGDTPQSAAGLAFPTYLRTTSMVFCIVILGIGVVGNVMVPIVILTSKDMRNSTNIFLMNLSVADLMVLLVCTPTVLVEVNSPPDVWVLGEEMCKAVPFVELTVAHASVLTILAISFERYYAICEPLKAGYVCTKSRAFHICVLAWAFAAILTSPILLIAEYGLIKDTTDYYCFTRAESLWKIVYFIMSISVFFLLPLCILMGLYTVIARHLMADPAAPGYKTAGTSTPASNTGTLSGSRVQSSLQQESSNYRARRQVVLMLGTVVLSFFICLLPFHLFTLWIIVTPHVDVEKIGFETFYNLLYFCRIMRYVNSAVNPILYNLMSSKFRVGFTRLCGLQRHRRGRWRRTTAGSEIRRSADLTMIRGDVGSLGGIFTRNGTLTSFSYSSFHQNNARNNSPELRLTEINNKEEKTNNNLNGSVRRSLIVRATLPSSATSSLEKPMLTRYSMRKSLDSQPESYV